MLACVAVMYVFFAVAVSASRALVSVANVDLFFAAAVLAGGAHVCVSIAIYIYIYICPESDAQARPGSCFD